MASTAVSARTSRFFSSSPVPVPPVQPTVLSAKHPASKTEPWRLVAVPQRHRLRIGVRASSRADDSPPFDMSVENALKVLGVSEGASFDEILRARNAIVASRKDDPEMITQVEAAYDMLLMQSLARRRSGKLADKRIRYADVKPTRVSGIRSMLPWVQTGFKNSLISIELPSAGDLGLQSGIFGTLVILAYVNGASSSSEMPFAGPDVPGLILASGFGASLYFIKRKNAKIGKAALITLGGLAAGAALGSVAENWLQVDIVPFLGIHSPAALVTEFILFSQLFVSLCVS